MREVIQPEALPKAHAITLIIGQNWNKLIKDQSPLDCVIIFNVMSEAIAFAVYEDFKPWSFGPHALLSCSDYYYFTSILGCKRCSLRRLYHKLAAKELSKSQSSEWFIESLKPKRYFHSIIRLIKVIDDIEDRLRSSESQEERSKLRALICKEHANEIFQCMIYSADHISHNARMPNPVPSVGAKWVNGIFPSSSSPPLPPSPPPRADSTSLTNLVPHLSKESEAVLLANWRWSHLYHNVDPENRQRKGVKRVSFPEGSPVTHVYSAPEYYFNVSEYESIHGISNWDKIPPGEALISVKILDHLACKYFFSLSCGSDYLILRQKVP